MSDAVQVGPDLLDDASLLGEGLAHLDPRFEAVHAVELRSGAVYPGFLIEDGRHREVVALADREVVGSWAGVILTAPLPNSGST